MKKEKLYREIIEHARAKSPSEIEPIMTKLINLKVAEYINKKKEEILGR